MSGGCSSGRLLPALCLAVAIAGCASPRLRDEGMVLVDDGRIEEGLALLRQAAAEHPGEPSYRVALIQARQRAMDRILADAREA